MERIKKWMLTQGYGGKSNGTGNYTPGAVKRLCNYCKWSTLPIPVKTDKCSSCGNFYNET